MGTKILECSSLFYKMVQHLHKTYAYPPICFKSSLGNS
jgi:hypothetical protein